MITTARMSLTSGLGRCPPEQVANFRAAVPSEATITGTKAMVAARRQRDADDIPAVGEVTEHDELG